MFFNLEKQKSIIVSGDFNPIHKGHLDCFNIAKAITDKLFVIVNNDHQRALKGSKEFQKQNERMIIVSNIKAVDKANLSIATDTTVCKTIESDASQFGPEFDLGFVNGGDKKNDTIAILTEWEEFILLDWKNISKETKVFDGRNILKSENLHNISFIGK